MDNSRIPSFRLSQGAYNLLQRLREEEVAVSRGAGLERWDDEEVPFDEFQPSVEATESSGTGSTRFDPPGMTPDEKVVGLGAAVDDFLGSTTCASTTDATMSDNNGGQAWWERPVGQPATWHQPSTISHNHHHHVQREKILYARPYDEGQKKPERGVAGQGTATPTGATETQKEPVTSRLSGTKHNLNPNKPKRSGSYRMSTAGDRGSITTARETRSIPPGVDSPPSDEYPRPDAVTPQRSKSTSFVEKTKNSDSRRSSSGDFRSSVRASKRSRKKQNFLDDQPEDMTYGRQLAIWMMRRFSWYYPRLDLDTTRQQRGTPADGASPRQQQPPQEERMRDGGRYRSEDGYPRSHSYAEQPSLEKAWAYFEHVTLTRHFHDDDPKSPNKKPLPVKIMRRLFCKGDKQLDRAEPGEADRPTRLYHPFFTPYKQLGDFGLGIGLYFASIRGLTVLVLLAGLIHMPNFVYFGGATYSSYQHDVNWLQWGSAICTDTQWVLCPTCTRDDFAASNEGHTWVYDPVHSVAFVRKNLCDGATLQTGFVNFTGFIFIMLGSVALSFYVNAMEKVFEDDEQTSQDYSIVVENPPPDARDPEEWKDYFQTAFDAHVTACCIAVDNDRLVRTLVERREMMRKLEARVPPGTSLDLVTLAGVATEREKERGILGALWAKLFVPGFPENFARLAVLTAKIQGLAQQEYPVTKVFITFEAQEKKHDVLHHLTVSKSQAARQKLTAVDDPKYVFRGEHLLYVKVPEEPDSIRWKHLNATKSSQFKQQLYTFMATVVALVAVAFVVQVVHETNTLFTAYTIAFTNVVFPAFAKLLTRFEAHPTHGSLQTSMYFKIALFRWFNTAFVITLITPFTDTLRNGSHGLITQIQAQFFAEISTVAALQISDPIGQIRRHILAPRAPTQDEMNLHMQGTQVELSERYTSISKLLFLTFWYCSIFPGTFFICALCLQVINWMDRFSLTRTWMRQPRLGPRISKFNRAYFLPLSIVAMGIMSSYFWSGFPFDNLCLVNETVTNMTTFHTIPVAKKELSSAWELDHLAIFELYYGSYYSDTNDTETETEIDYYLNFSVEEGSSTYKYCNQDMLRSPDRQTYPFVPIFQKHDEEWMTDEQEIVTTYFGWLAFFLSVGWVVIIFFTWAHNLFLGYFMVNYHKPKENIQHMNFSEQEAINIYFPEVSSWAIAFPLLAASVDGIDPEVFEWQDADHPHAYYDLTKDAEALVRNNGKSMAAKAVFSQVAYWPPDTSESTSTLP